MILEINKRFYPISLKNVEWYEFVDGKLMIAYSDKPSRVIALPEGTSTLLMQGKIETAFEKILQ